MAMWVRNAAPAECASEFKHLRSGCDFYGTIRIGRWWMSSRSLVHDARRSTRIRLKVVIEAREIAEPFTCDWANAGRELARSTHRDRDSSAGRHEDRSLGGRAKHARCGDGRLC